MIFLLLHERRAVLLASFLFFATSIQVFAQQLPICQGGEELAHSCSTACILCDLNGYNNTTIQVTPGDPPPGFCTFVVHNIGWVGFIAGSTDLTFNVEVFPCTLGNSIELGIYEAPDCMNSHLVGTCNTEMIEGNTYSFNNTEPLNPGCVYFLVFDNNGPASCPFTVTVTSGSATAPNPGPTPTPVGPTEICPGAVVTYSVPPVFGTCEYTWTAPPGSLINGSPSPVSIQGEDGATVEIAFGNSAGDVCVETGNICAGYSEACLPVTLQAIPPTTLPPVSICNGTTLEWMDGETYSSTQLLSITLPSWLGCDSIVNQQLIVRPPITTNLGTLSTCPGECVNVGGIDFCAPGFYQVQLTSYLQCDSTLLFLLNQVPVHAEIAPPDTLDCTQNSVLLNGSASSTNATYGWYNSQNVLLGTNNSLSVSSAGVYHLIVERMSGNQTCKDTAWVTVVANYQLPLAIAQGDTLNCQGDSLQLNGTTDVSGAIFTWTGPGIDSTNQNLEDPWLNVPGTYILNVHNPANGCMAKDTALVESMGATPDLMAPDRDTVNCKDPVVWLVAQSSVPGVSFAWMAPDSTITLSDSVQALQNGLWIVQATAPGGCIKLDTSLLLLDTLTPGIVASGGTLDCSGTPIAIHGSSPDSSATFAWTGPGNFSAQVPDTTVTLSGNYTLVVTLPNGCSASATAPVLSNTNVPNLSASGWDTLTCSQTSITVNASSNSPGAVISWAGTGSFNAMGNSIQITSPGQFTVTAATPNGCQSSLNFSVPIDTAAPVLSIQGDTLDCYHPVGLVLGICAEPFVQFQWTGPGVLQPTAPNSSVNSPGIYNLLVTDPVTGCTASAQTIVSADMAPPALTVGPAFTLTCAMTNGLLWVNSLDTGVSFGWTSPNGFADDQDTILVNIPGDYLVKATGVNGCRDSILLTVPANTTPPNLSATGGIINCLQPSVQLVAQTNTPGVTFQWTGPNGFNSTNPSPITTESGLFQLLGTAPNGCTAQVQVLVSADFAIPVLDASSNLQVLNCTNAIANLQVQSNMPGTQFQWSLMGMPMGGNATLAVQSPGAYVVSGAGANGCVGADTITLLQDISIPQVFAQGNTLFCNSSSVPINGGSTTPGASLQWSGPGNFSSTLNIPSVSLPGNYTLLVTGPNGCTNSAVAVVLPDSTAPDLSIQPASTLTCSLLSTSLTANSNTAGAVFQWTGPGNFSASGPVVQTQMAGLYTVQVTAPNGCSNFQTITVMADTVAPLATAIGGTLTCSNTVVALNGSSNVSGVAYAWSGPNNFSAAQATVQATQAGLYGLTLTASNGCTGTASALILQDTLPPNLSINGGLPLTCAQTSTAIQASSSTMGVSWGWTGPGNFTASTPDILVSMPGNYSVTVTASNGCTASSSLLATQNTVPPTTTANGGLLTCMSPALAILGQSSDPLALFHWAGPGNFSFDGASPTVNLPGTYTLTVTGANGCTATTMVAIMADQLTPVFTLAGQTITCSIPAVTAAASGFANGTSFQWSGPGGFQQQGVMVNISVPGVYQVEAQGTNGCTATQSLTIPADLVAPQMVLQGGVLTCRDTVVQILANVTPSGAQLSWSGPQLNLPAQSNVMVQMPGLYTLTATASNGCSAEGNVTVTQLVPTWSVGLGPDQSVWEGAFVSVHAQTDLPAQEVADIFWTPSFNCAHCLDQVFKAKDSVFLQITVEDESGCRKTDGLQINVRKRGSIYVPNVFSPDGDGNNDEFQVFAGNPATLVRSFQIFDRWGEQVFTQKDFHPGESVGKWNGTLRGNLLRPAVFVWVLEVEYEDGSKELLSGDVLLKL